MNPLKQLEQAGQSPWLDFVQRHLIESGELKTMVERDGLKGVTSNPTIFEKAIGKSKDYGEALEAFLKKGDQRTMAVYEYLAGADIQAGADVLRPVYDASNGHDGYISFEVSPYLGFDTEETVQEARRLWKMVGRPNLMVKVPATREGIPAIRRLIGEGINVNVTLLFAVEVYEQVAEAYIAGLEELVRNGGDPSRIGSVASFFVSRIDSLVDKKLDERIKSGADKASLDALRGKIAIANAKIAYERYKKIFSGPRWEALKQKGAHTQRLLWASTSTKNPAYSDTLYVEALIGRDTVNTLPPATMDAFRDHGKVIPDAVEQDLEGAKATLEALRKAGVSLEEVTDELVADGVKSFAQSFDDLLATVAARRAQLSQIDRMTLHLPDALRQEYEAEAKRWTAEGMMRRLWRGDKTLWTNQDEDHWLDWMNIVAEESKDADRLRSFAAEVKGKFTDMLLIGMGGSSLGPEVLAETFGHQQGWPKFHMLDSTDPAQIASVEKALDLPRTLVIVSSKSGSTLEPNILLAYFRKRLIETVGEVEAGRHLVAVTDPGSALEKQAQREKFAHVFHGVPAIGGRYSVLSKFGLVPAAAMGIDVRNFLDKTAIMVGSCAGDVPAAVNPGIQLGLAMGLAAAKFGRDKVTIVASPGIADLGAWLEQLIAESTGKQGKGLIPVDAEPEGAPETYGNDRFFAYLALQGDADEGQRAFIERMEKAGHPVIRIEVRGAEFIGQEFFRWEMATAVAGAVIGINPFDQPDVEASKVKTRALTDDYEKSGRLGEGKPIFQANGIAIFADERNAEALGRHNTLSGYLQAHFGRVHEGDYAAILAYIERNPAHAEILQRMRAVLREKTRAATCLGFGPRFLHSTGQAYKGGPNTGVFLQITDDNPRDLPVLDRKYTFGVVKAAQAQGDMEVLVERKRRVMRVHLKDVDSGLREIAQAVEEAFSA
ncbi:MAG TPA: bifunctional transaldolase/phosoglucose isomerase [Acetobacteraceae bacterium]|nr:bifunctional transaldolase/phosoglucose isomerase [Acetobacteraceae bacterium]